MLEQAMAARAWRPNSRALDYGCGNGSMTDWLARKGFDAVGVDISESGIEAGRKTFPRITFSTDVSAESLAQLGPFDLALCTEVIAHCYMPSADLEKIFNSLRPGGMLLLTTPYHGYLKNLALSVSGRLQRHLDTLWPGAYVHFFTPSSITALLRKTGFRDISIARVGRIPALAKSMVVTCFRPE